MRGGLLLLVGVAIICIYFWFSFAFSPFRAFAFSSEESLSMKAPGQGKTPARRRTLIVGALVVAALLLVMAPRLRRAPRPVERPSERHYRAGLGLARAGNGPKAVAEWTLAIAMDPADTRPYQALASYYEDIGQPALAVERLKQMARANPAAPHPDCRLAQAAFAAGWVTQATAAAERAVREEPSCPLAHTMRGIVLDDAGESTAALAELTKAHQLSPGDERIALTLAQIEGRSGRRSAAVSQVRSVLQQDPELPQAHYLLGWLLARATPHTAATDAEAVRHLRQMLAQDPQHAGALGELGALYVRQGQYARARPLLEAGERQSPTDPGIAHALALADAHLGDPHAPALADLGRRLDERQQRRRALRRRHLLRPADAAVTVQLARVELSDGQIQEATDLVNQVLHADPNNRGALDLVHEIMGG
jgi:Flp pilus assembly protein TadD